MGFTIVNGVLRKYHEEPGIIEVEVPFGITRIAKNAFYGCKNIELVMLPYGVVSIGESAFKGCSNLKTVYLPDSLEKIEDKAFCFCYNLSSIILPDELTSIGKACFQNCSKLDEVAIPDNVTLIDSEIFSNCWNLQRVKFPYNLETIEKSAFANCSRLESVVLPDKVTKIRDNAFDNCTKLKEISIPDSVFFIGVGAFSYCEKLQKIELPERIEKVNEYTFYKCSNLNSVTMSQSIKCIEDSAFEDCTSLEKVVLSDAITRIGSNAFKNCLKLNNVDIPMNCESIGNYAFYNCTALENLDIPSTIIDVSENSFELTKWFENRCDFIVVGDGVLYKYVGMEAKITMPSNIKHILTKAFADNSFIEKVIIPDNVISVHSGAFEGCSNLKSVEFYNQMEHVNDRLFKGCYNLESIILPAGVKIIGEEAFQACHNLQTIKISNSIESIKKYAFADCNLLNNVILPKSMQVISEGMFQNCQSLNDIKIPYGIHYIAENAFIGCKNMKDVEVPYSVKKIDNYVFENDVTIYAQDPSAALRYAKKKQLNYVISSYNTYSEMSDVERVVSLEKIVIDGDIERLTEIFDKVEGFEFTARALGIACKLSQAEIVKKLIEEGATFRYFDSSAMSRRYHPYTKRGTNTYKAQYELLLIFDEKFNYYLPSVNMNVIDYHFGDISFWEEYGLLGKTNIDAENRISIMNILFEKNDKVKCDFNSLLYYSVLWNQDRTSSFLIEKGIGLPEEVVADLESNNTSARKNELFETLANMEPSESIETIKKLQEIGHFKISLSVSAFDLYGNTFLNTNVFYYAYSNMKMPYDDDLIKVAVRKERIDILKYLGDKGIINHIAQIRALIKFANKHGCSTSYEWLKVYSELFDEAVRLRQSISIENHCVSGDFSKVVLDKLQIEVQCAIEEIQTIEEREKTRIQIEKARQDERIKQLQEKNELLENKKQEKMIKQKEMLERQENNQKEKYQESRIHLEKTIRLYHDYISISGTVEIDYYYEINGVKLGIEISDLIRKIKIGTVDERDIDLINSIPWTNNRKALCWDEWLLLCKTQVNRFATCPRNLPNVEYDKFYKTGKWLSRQCRNIKKLPESQKKQIEDLYSEIIQKNNDA